MRHANPNANGVTQPDSYTHTNTNGYGDANRDCHASTYAYAEVGSDAKTSSHGAAASVTGTSQISNQEMRNPLCRKENF